MIELFCGNSFVRVTLRSSPYQVVLPVFLSPFIIYKELLYEDDQFQNVYIGGNLVKLGFWVGICTLGGGDFFQVGLENSLYKK